MSQHYRLYKIDPQNGRIVKGKDMSASDDQRALDAAAHDDDCPVCELWRGAKKVGGIA